MALSTAIPLGLNERNLVNFCPLTPEITWLMFAYLMLTVRVWCMLTHLILGHMTLLPG